MKTTIEILEEIVLREIAKLELRTGISTIPDEEPSAVKARGNCHRKI